MKKETRNPSKIDQVNFINGASVIPGDDSIDISDLKAIFTGKNFNAKALRSSGWQRKK